MRKIIEDILDRVERRLADNSYGAYKQGVEDTVRAIYREMDEEVRLNEAD